MDAITRTIQRKDKITWDIKLFGGTGMKENNEIAEVIKQIQQEAVEKYMKGEILWDT